MSALFHMNLIPMIWLSFKLLFITVGLIKDATSKLQFCNTHNLTSEQIRTSGTSLALPLPIHAPSNSTEQQ
jgi:hypothetical protein